MSARWSRRRRRTCLMSQQRRPSRCCRCSWRRSCAQNGWSGQSATGGCKGVNVPLLVGEHVAPDLLLPLLDHVDVGEHTVRLEAGRELSCKVCRWLQRYKVERCGWSLPAVTAFRCKPAREMSWRINLCGTSIGARSWARSHSPFLPEVPNEVL